MHLDSKRVVTELGAACFRDRRLAARLQGLAERLVLKPDASFPKALGDSAGLEAAYRFFGNVAVSPDAILDGHFKGVRRRCEREDTVLAIHDTTAISFRHDGQRRGDDGKALPKQRFFAHLSLVISDDGVRRPLGVAALGTWYRGSSFGGGGWHDEYDRWWLMAQLTAQRLSHGSVVHIMDREADDYWLFHNLTSSGQRFIVRARASGARTRMLVDDDFRQLHEAVASLNASVERDVTLSKRRKTGSPVHDTIHPPRESRLTQLSIAARALTLKRPKRHPKQSKARRAATIASTIALNVVRVWEPTPPPGEKPVEWVLLTTDPIDSDEQILKIVDRYRARWTIEEYFKALKTGCAYEARQLADYESLANALAVFAPIACTLLDLRSEARRTPDAPAELVLTKSQLEVLRVMGRVPLPEAPTQREALLAIAALGGHIKRNGEPGWQTLGSGYRELVTLTAGWEAAKLHLARDQ
ncbi:MAG TPA: IS4 family transposase [Polyangiaceae bacterium]|nr:IS4 family transposase [Polyangiaceae bacterium]